MPSASHTTDANHRQLYKQLDALRRRLIDTGGRSRLISVNLSSDRGRFLTLAGQDVDAIFKQLWDGSRHQGFTFRAIDATRPLAKRELQTRLDQIDLDKRLLSIHRESKTAVQEHGMHLLYLVLGFLKWAERDTGGPMRTSPLILVPVTLERTKRNRYLMIFREEELEQNLSLAKRLHDDFKVTLPVPDANTEIPSEYFSRVHEAIVDPEAQIRPDADSRSNWTVLADQAQLGFFSFGKLRMYRDLHPVEGKWPKSYLEHHTLAEQVLAEGFGKPATPIIDTNKRLDDQLTPEMACHVVDADNSQARVLEEVRHGRSLLIQGPPGTGKSQTITNIIAAAVTRDKNVLFVAEKMAALEVVSGSLTKIGLKEMLLELHSNKAIKSRMFQDLGRTLDWSMLPALSQNNDGARQMETMRNQLNDAVETVHAPLSPGGYTAYDIMDTIAHFDRSGLVLDFELPGTAGFTNDRLSELRQLISEWHSSLTELGDLSEHPLRAIRAHSLAPPYETSVGRPLVKLSETVHEYGAMCAELEQVLGRLLGKRRLRQGAADLGALMQLLTDPPTLELGRYIVALDVLVNDLPAFNVARVHDELNRWFAPRRHGANHQLGKLVGDVVHEWSLDKRRAVARFLRHTQELVNDKQLSRRSLSPLARDLGLSGLDPSELVAASHNDWNILRDWAAQVTGIELESATGKHVLDALRAVRAVNAEQPALSERLATARKNFTRARKDAMRKLRLDACAVVDTRDEATEVNKHTWLDHKQRPRVVKVTDTMLKALDHYPDWADYLRQRELLVDAQLEPLVAFCENEHSSVGHVLHVFEYAVALARLDQRLSVDCELGDLLGEDQDQTVQQFCDADVASLLSARTAVRDSHYEAFPRGEGGSMATVRTEARKRRQHPAIRQFIHETRDVLPRIKPVFLMSPASVAQYLPIGGLQFDLVVFDEASQITPEDAIGSILRAKPDGQVVIVGDPQQLPPSRFFQRITSDDIESEEDSGEDPVPRLHENESILTMGAAQGLPMHMLMQHYRSKIPSLVEVSNHIFYDDKLTLPPSPIAQTDQLGLRYISVHGTYHPQGYGSGLSNTNPREADAICEALAHHARNHADLTVGVVAFSDPQSRLIEERVWAARREDGVLDQWMSGMDDREDVFIKNLENVQGDERDVILISVGYGPQEDGSMTMNFGPINDPGGERRLNVLFTRARWRCDVYCSFDPTSITTQGAVGEGRRVLKEYLMSAQNATFNEAKIRGDRGDTYVEADIADEIEKLGYNVEQAVGPDGFVVDLAVRNPKHPEEFMLAVEIDGATYRRALSARERDRMRRSVLQGHGWRHHRVWMTEWFRHRQKAVRKLRDALEAAEKEMGDGVRVMGSNEPPDESNQEGMAGADPKPSPLDDDSSMSLEIPKHYGSIDDVPDKDIRVAIEWARSNNGELSHEELVQEVRKRLGFSRLGSNIRSRIESALHESDDED